MQDKETRRLFTPELLLVIVMLGLFSTLVAVVLFWPIPDIGTPNASDSGISDILDYRKNILAVIVTVFGAWIGAGAAYHFGRENLKEATSSMLQMREPSPKERLRKTLVREMPLKSLDWFVKTSDQVKDIADKLKGDTQRWFIPIVDDRGKLITLIHEEAIWRFLDTEIIANKAEIAENAHNAAMEKPVKEVLDYIDKEGLKRLKEICVQVSLDKTAGDAYEQMQSKGVYLAVVSDETGKPTHYFTTGDVRRVLLEVG